MIDEFSVGQATERTMLTITIEAKAKNNFVALIAHDRSRSSLYAWLTRIMYLEQGATRILCK